jgi:hypothetical protein
LPVAVRSARRYGLPVAAKKDERQRDEHGRFLPKEETGKAKKPRGAKKPTAAKAKPDAEKPEPSAEKPAGHRETIDISDTPAPSIGPHTTFEREPPEERLAHHEISDSDAMGLDKRRTVVGKSYGPSFAKQATLYGGFIVIVVVLAIGFKLLADELDKPPDTVKAEAEWTNSDIEPAPLDFPRNGNPELEGP